MNDTFKTIVIIAVFAILVLNITLGLSKHTIQQEWATYRCNPLIMPFAGKIAPDGMSTNENFAYCVQDVVKSFAPIITGPLEYVQSMTLNLVDNSATTQKTTMKEQQKFSTSSGNMFGNIFNIFLGVVVEFRIMLTRLTDSQSKLSGVVATLMYMMTAVMYTFQSMWDGIPGGMIRMFSKIKK